MRTISLVAWLVLILSNQAFSQLTIVESDYVVDYDCVAAPREMVFEAVINQIDPCEDALYAWEVWFDFNSDWTYEYTFSSDLDSLDDNFGTPENEYFLGKSQSGDTISLTIPEELSASKYYHRIVWKTIDNCGNSLIRTQEFLIIDTLHPLPYCHKISSVILNEGSDSVELWACDFVVEGMDNCTSSEKMRYTFTSTPPSDDPDYIPSLRCSSKLLTCNEVLQSDDSIVDIEVFIWDEYGNVDSCTSQVFVNGCPNLVGCCFMEINGKVNSANERHIDNLEVQFSATNFSFLEQTITNESGEFGVELIYSTKNIAEEVKVKVISPTDYLNGVTALDAELIEKHILNIQPIVDEYKLLAADVNKDGVITSLDKYYVDQLIAGEIDSFPNSPSWSYVNRNFEPSQTNPVLINNTMLFDLDCMDFNLDIVGIKMGDVNCSVVVSSNTTEIVKSGFQVYQNVPNPVTNSTAIPFAIPISGEVSIELYTLTGEKLFNASASFPQGEHCYTLDSSTLDNLTNGIYIYAVRFGGITQTQKLIKH